MNKAILLLLLIFIIGFPLISKAQYKRQPDDNEQNNNEISPGDELIKAGGKFMKGLTCQVLGIGVGSMYFVVGDITRPDGTKDMQLKNIAAAAGGVLFLTGTIIQITSWGNIVKAGKKMNERERELELSFGFHPYGGGICMRF